MGVLDGNLSPDYAKGLPLTTLPGSILSSRHSCPATRSQDWNDTPSRRGETMDSFIFQKNKAGLRATESRRTMENSDKEGIAKRCVHLRADALADPALVSLHLLPCGVWVTTPPPPPTPAPWGASSASHPSSRVLMHWKCRFGAVVYVPRRWCCCPASWDMR